MPEKMDDIQKRLRPCDFICPTGLEGRARCRFCGNKEGEGDPDGCHSQPLLPATVVHKTKISDPYRTPAPEPGADKAMNCAAVFDRLKARAGAHIGFPSTPVEASIGVMFAVAAELEQLALALTVGKTAEPRLTLDDWSKIVSACHAMHFAALDPKEEKSWLDLASKVEAHAKGLQP